MNGSGSRFLLKVVPLFLFFIFRFGYLPAQDSLRFKIESRLFEVSQEIPGLSYVFHIEEKEKDLSIFSLKQSAEKGIWISDTLSDYKIIAMLKDTLYSTTGNEGELSFLIFGKEAEDETTYEFLENLVRNELLMTNEVSKINETEEGVLVVMASKVPFSPYYRLKTKILSDTKMLLMLSVFVLFLIASIVLVTIMYVVKVRKGRRDSMTLKFKELSFEPISNLLFEHSLDELQCMDRMELEGYFPSDHLKNNLFKDVMIAEIISLNKNMKGEFKSKLKTIYRKFDLDSHSIKKLSSKKWDIITSGIVEINEMDVVEAVDKVKKFASSENFYVRTNAVATLLNISNDPELKVLVNQDYPLSKWQQMVYFRIIKFINSQEKVRVDLLFESKNESVRVFGYKLVRYLGLFELLDIISLKYKEASIAEKLEMIKCFNVFSYQDALDIIHRDLYTKDKTLFLGVVSVLQNIGNPISEVILFKRLKSGLDFESKKAVMQTLNVLNHDELASWNLQTQDTETHQIFDHLTDPVLSNV